MRLRRALVSAALLAGSAAATCPPQGETSASLQALKAGEWKQPEAEDLRQLLALALLDCLSDPSPFLRDEVAYEALQHWMRTGRLTPATLHALRVQLLAALAAPPDPAGFTQPFAALVLAEVARVDRLHANLSDAERAELAAAATRWLAGWRDYRAFEAPEGWRHGVAHGADLMLQLALNKKLHRAQADAMLKAIATQVMPPGAVAYQHGEADRLAAPVYYLAHGSLLSTTDWQHWFSALVEGRERRPINAVNLAAKHNLSSFLNSLYVAVQEVGNAEVKARLLPGLKSALREAQ
jgi:hypothetical protein